MGADWERSIVFIIISSFFLSLLAFCLKIVANDATIFQLTVLRYVCPLLIISLYFSWKGVFLHLHFTKKVIYLQLLRSFMAVCSQVTLCYYLTKGTLTNGTVLSSAGTLVIPMLSFVFYKESIRRITWVSSAIIFFGILFIIKPNSEIFDSLSIWGIISGLSGAFSQILFGTNTPSNDRNIGENIFYFYLFSSVFSFIPVVFLENQQWSRVHCSLLFVVALLGIVISSLGNQIFRGKAYKSSSPALLSPFLYTPVFVSAILDWAFFHYIPNVLSYIGFFLVIVGMVIKWIGYKKVQQ